MIVVLSAVAFADPVALRGPLDAPALGLGLETASVALPAGQFFAVAADVAWNASQVGVSAAWRPSRRLGDGLWRLEGSLGLGVGARTVQPDLVVTVSPAMLVSAVGGRGVGGFGLAVPAEMTLLSPPGWYPPWGVEASIPLLLELQGGARVGPVWLVARLSQGPVLTPDVDVSYTVRPALWMGYKGGKDAQGP